MAHAPTHPRRPEPPLHTRRDPDDDLRPRPGPRPGPPRRSRPRRQGLVASQDPQEFFVRSQQVGLVPPGEPGAPSGWVFELAPFGGPIGYIRENLHDELRGGHWREMGEDPQAAEAQALHGLGLPEGAPVSQLGDLKDSYFLQLARLRVISEAADVDSFWQSTDADREKVYQILSSTGAQAVIAKAPVFTRSLDGWVLIGDSGFLFHSLK